MAPADPPARPSVRATAARLVDRIVRGQGTVESTIDRTRGLDPRDLALLRALVAGALRWHHRFAWLAAELTDNRRIEPLVGALIHVGFVQLIELATPPHAAVAATVDAAAELGLGRARGFVNAVLRRFLREQEADPAGFAERGGDVWRYSHPDWLVAAIRSDWPDCWQDVLDANNARAPMWLRVNLGRIGRDEYLARLAGAGIDASPGADGAAAVRLAAPCRTADLPGFAEGLVSVQDAAAQLAASLLAPAPGERILDACAAPGGKTAHILESGLRLAELVALDRDGRRLGHVATELDRLGLAATLIEADATRPGDWWDGRPFDRILLDAPCSGTGVIRRHPEIKLRRQPADVARACERQDALLEALWPLLAPGGRLVYATCSALTVENAERTGQFLAAHRDAVAEPLGSPTHFRVRPGSADRDGFYYACLTRSDGR